MTYEETLHYLYTSIPVFQHSGASAYKPGLGTSIALDDYLGNPHRAYPTIHVAGTNGKGSVSHLLAAILQQSGYKVGLYTSPHLIDFRERIRVNGQMISQDYVIRFVEQHRTFFESLSPSFFELTSSLAFDYFRAEKVDFAIIEVGLGGRLDSTNIIHPILSVITNISLDHTQFLGNTLEEIAGEKAGIIKPGVPVVIGDVEEAAVFNVFLRKAEAEGAPLYASTQERPITTVQKEANGQWLFSSADYGLLTGQLSGAVQQANAQTVLTTVRRLVAQQVKIQPCAVKEGFAHVTSLTGLMGRWQQLQSKPTVICDTGHNIGGWEPLAEQLERESRSHTALRMVVGMVNDKDISGVLRLMPRQATYYFTQAAIERAMPAEAFADMAREQGLTGKAFPTVAEAIRQALADAAEEDLIFIGGSTFIVADALPLFNSSNL